MTVEDLLRSFDARGDREAVVSRDRGCGYARLAGRVRRFMRELEARAVEPGTVVLLEADFSPDAAALFLALAGRECVVVPLSGEARRKRDEFAGIAGAEATLSVGEGGALSVERTGRRAAHELYGRLRALGRAGLILFTSGSTAAPKAVAHDMTRLLARYASTGRARRTIAFLLFDHIGGVNTMLYTLASGGRLVTVEDRSPDSVLAAVERHAAELLPTSPTFLNLVLLSEAHLRHDLSSLEVVSYGTEPMPEVTLERLRRALPRARLVQTYGLSEVGIMRSRSRGPGSLWVRLGGEGFETRVVGGTLQVRADSAMLGYLNAPSPFTADGWLDTGDRVEVDGEFVRILGRGSDVISVGGEKVSPVEVESVLLELDCVAEATVHGERNPITGEIVCARITPRGDIDPRELVRRAKDHCRARLPAHKVPVRVALVEGPQHTERFKTVRPGSP